VAGYYSTTRPLVLDAKLQQIILSSPYFSAPFLPVPKSPLIHRKYEMASFGGSLELSHRFFLWSDREPSFVCIEPHVVMWIFVSETPSFYLGNSRPRIKTPSHFQREKSEFFGKSE
jgi:hypothetical protein